MEMYRIERFDTVVSTNELVKHAIEKGYAEGLVCRAAEQVGGYGRQGRTWASPRGGLYQSVLLRPAVAPDRLSTLGLVIALCIRRALMSAGALASADVQVKWPNDVVCAAGKLAGISLEAHAGGVCAGIGVNVWRPAATDADGVDGADDKAAGAVVGGKNTPAYLADIARNGLERECDREGGVQHAVDFVGDEVMAELWRRYARWQREGFAPFLDEFNAVNALAGKHVKIADRNGAVVAEGPVAGVSERGSLLVGTRSISSGEAHVL